LIPKLSFAGLVSAALGLAMSVVPVGVAVQLMNAQSAGRPVSGWLIVNCALAGSSFVLALVGLSFTLASSLTSKVPTWVIVVTAMFAVMGIATSCLCGCGSVALWMFNGAVITG
jgi:hypothetical protein